MVNEQEHQAHVPTKCTYVIDLLSLYSTIKKNLLWIGFVLNVQCGNIGPIHNMLNGQTLFLARISRPVSVSKHFWSRRSDKCWFITNLSSMVAIILAIFWLIRQFPKYGS